MSERRTACARSRTATARGSRAASSTGILVVERRDVDRLELAHERQQRRCSRPCTPAPTIVATRESGRASRSTLTIAAPAVRAPVMWVPSITHTGLPVSGSYRVIRARWLGRPCARLPSKTETCLTPISPPVAIGRHREQEALAGNRDLGPRRGLDLPAGDRGEAVGRAPSGGRGRRARPARPPRTGRAPRAAPLRMREAPGGWDRPLMPARATAARTVCRPPPEAASDRSRPRPRRA